MPYPKCLIRKASELMNHNDELKINSLVNALTIEERITVYEQLGLINSEFETMQDWLNTKGMLNSENSGDIFEYLNVTQMQFNNAFKKLDAEETIRVYNAICEYPWVKRTYEIFTYYYENVLSKDILDKIQPLNHSVAVLPYVFWLQYQLEHKIINLQNYSIGPQVREQIILKANTVLVGAITKTFVYELHAATNGSDDDNGFAMFIQDSFLNYENLIAFYEKYPVICRCLTQQTENLINCFSELLDRLDADIDYIYSEFEINHPKVLTGISCDEGDTHQQGRFVMQLKFSDSIVVYKPRNLLIQAKFSDFITYFNEYSGIVDLHANKALHYDNYTYESFVSYKECLNEVEVTKYYQRFGALCAIIYILGGNDMHYENIIAHGSYPVAIDVETLFQHKTDVFYQQESAMTLANNEVSSSVWGMSLFPIFVFNQKQTQKGIDISALNGQGGVLPDNYIQLVDVDTSKMRYDYASLRISDKKNIVMCKGKKISYTSYTGEIISSFQKSLAFFADHKDYLLEKNSPFMMFRDVAVRYILRTTQHYSRLLEFASHPKYSQNMLALERMYYNLWVSGLKRNSSTPYEIYDLLERDIPIFYGTPGSCDLETSKGKLIRNYFQKTGIEIYSELLTNINEKEIDKQTSYIQLSTGSLELTKRNDSRISNMPISTSPLSQQSILEEIQLITDDILRESIFHSETGTISWVNPIFDKVNEVWKMAPISFGLVTGLAGLLLYFYEVSKFLPQYTKTITNIKNTLTGTLAVAPTISPLIDLSLYSGITGLIYPLAYMQRDKPTGSNLHLINSIISILEIEIGRVEDISVEHGLSGILLMLVSLCTVIDNPRYVALTKRTYLMLKKHQNSNSMCEHGFANGICGTIYAIQQYEGLFGNNNCEEYIVTSPRQRTKNDIGWSNKHSLLTHPDPKEWLTNEYSFSNNTLADGDMYHINAQISIKGNGIKMQNQIARIISTKKANGEYLVQSLPGYTNISLFNGLTGIAYTLLRTIDGSVPDALSLSLHTISSL